MFCEWLGIAPKSLQYVLDMHRNEEIWEYDDDRNWRLKNRLNISPKSKSIANFSFKNNSSFPRDIGDGYITIGKGYP